MVKKIDETEKNLASQIPDFDLTNKEKPSKISDKFIPGGNKINQDDLREFEQRANVSKLGDNIFENAEARKGWIPIDRRLLGDRNKFYPEDWTFLVRPATVEAVRNWSMIDENNGNSIDEVFNEILKYCLAIKTPIGNMAWQAINNWDRFFFVLLIREYTFVKGESNIEFYEDCPNCDAPVKFTLNSQALMYDIPDESVMQYYDENSRVWTIYPSEFGVNYEREIELYAPTLEKDANIKLWLINEHNENQKKKFDTVFLKFLPWLCPKISKDFNVARSQIKKAEMLFKSWDTDMFTFMDEVLKNISVTPSTNISAICDACGEEATARIRFPNGISSLFNVVNRHTKFGTK